jgi:opacity protein-like surface antigen
MTIGVEMNKKILVAALLAASVTGAYAQSKFEGFYGQVGIGYSTINPSVSNSTLTPPAGNTPSSYGMGASVSAANSFNGALGAGYTWSLAPQFTLGLGVDYQPFAGQSANVTLSNASLSPASQTVSYKQNSAYDIYLAPGFAVTPESMIYGKFGFAGTQIKTTTSNGSSGTTNYNGFLVGLGYKQIISGGLYGFAEANYTSFGGQTQTASGPWTSGTTGTYNLNTNTSANAFNAMVGLGYKF